jgi:tRNA (mo5U34)-methyltransferase
VGVSALARETDARTAVAGVRRWYHCVEVVPGIVTPGLFDLRPVVDRLPWPDVRGRRCLDVGTADGYFAFELERRGAAEVVAVDLAGHESWDWEHGTQERGLRYLHHVSGPQPGDGFRVAHQLLASSVRFQPLSVYDLKPEAVGEFDAVVCGSLLLHLRDPLGALAAIHSVCAGQLLCTNQIDLRRSLWAPRSPLIRLDGTSGITQWWLPNAAGHRQMLRAAGFAIERQSRLYCIPYGPAHPVVPRRPRWLVRSAARRAVAGNDGVAHHAVLARPR